MGIPRAKTEPLFRTAVEEARFRLDIVHRLLGTGDDLPDWFFGPLTTYRLLLEDFLEDPGGLVYLGIVIAVLSASTTKFETLVLAGMIQVYAAVLYNFSVIGVVTDTNNYAAFVRFQLLAAAQGVTENEDGPFEDQEKALADTLKASKTPILIDRIANAAVSFYALFKIVQAVFFA